MMLPDIDIDFSDRAKALSLFEYTIASRNQNDMLVQHNTGVYFQKIPKNPLTNLSNIDYKSAANRGYFKIDFLNVNLYKDIKSEEHLNHLLTQEPLWELLLQDDFVNLLFHVNGHGTILRKMQPKTVEQLAAVIAMIRPGKKHLIGKSWEEVMTEIWIKPENDEYYFKKSHAISYASVIVVQMNLICEQLQTATS